MAHTVSTSWFKYEARGSSNIQVEVPKGVHGQTRDVLEQCMTTSGEAAGFKAKRRSRARKEASAEEVRGYYSQFAGAKHLECKSWVDNEVFDLVSLRKVKSRNYVQEDGCLPSRRANRVTSSRQRQDGCWEISKTNRRNINRQIPLLPQDPDFGLVAKWQPAKGGTFFTLISRQLSCKDSLIVWIVMLCVNCYHKQIILPIWTKHCAVTARFPREQSDVVMCCTQPKRVSQMGTKCALHRWI